MGARNKLSVEREKHVAAEGITPLDFLLGVLRDEGRPYSERFEAAKAAAPFVHPRISPVNAVQHEANLTHEEWLEILDDKDSELG